MPRKYESTGVRRRQIVNAARKVIIKYGSEHVTVKRIAREVGISETAVYRHFKSKKDILLLLVEYIEKSLVEDITKAASKGNTPLEILNNVLSSHLSAVEQRRGISFQVIAEIISLGDKKLNSRVSQAIEKYMGCTKGLLVEGIRSGEIREDIDLDAVATSLFGIIQGLVNIWALRNYSFDAGERYTALWTVFREAIIKRRG
jgi:AcrR family transcriptional regulator